MPEIAKFLFEHLGGAAIILFFGFLADHFSTQQFKAEVAGWLAKRHKLSFQTHNVQKVLTSFLDGFLYRVYGHQIFSLRFFLRSCGVSILFLAVGIAVQAIYYPDYAEQLRLSESVAVAI